MRHSQMTILPNLRRLQTIVLLYPSLALGLLASCETQSEAKYQAVKPFETGQLCDTIDREAELSIPVSVTQTLNGKGKGEDGFDIADAILADSAQRVAHASPNAQACQDTFAQGERIFSSFLASKQDAFRKLGSFRRSKDAEIAKAQEAITNFWRDDQMARGVYVGLRTEDDNGANFWAERLSAAHVQRLDASSQKYLSRLLETYDWIDRKRFGKKVSDRAWLLAQHADNDPGFQVMVLGRMEAYLETKGVSRENYAFLWDRVAVNTGQLQRYGTQPDWNCVDGKMQLQPMEDPLNVDERRSQMGMGPVAKSLERMSQQTC